MYKPEFKDQHKSLTELVSWLTAWEKHNKNQKRQNEGNDGINRKRQFTNESSGHGKHHS